MAAEPARISSADEYVHTVARRDLIAASLLSAADLPPGAMPTKVRIGLKRYLATLEAQIHEYDLASRLGV